MAFPSGWARKCAITINSAQVYGGTTHARFPVCLTKDNLPAEMLDKDGSHPAQMMGGDIRFSSDPYGYAKLPCHVIEFVPADNPANGKATIYVAADVSPIADTTIYVWYGATSRIEQPKYDANLDADGFKGSDFVWQNYDIVLALGGLGGFRNLKQANATKGLGRFGNFNAKPYTVAERASGNTYISFPSLVYIGERLYCCAREATTHAVTVTGQVTVRYSDDLGRTWAEDTGLAVTDATRDLRDPQFLKQSDGTLWLFYSKTDASDTSRVVAYRKASAPYSSWGPETVLTSQTKANGAGKPVELASGRIVVPCYDIDGSGNTAPFIRWTTDAGSTWTTNYLTSDGTAPGSYGAYNEFSVAENPTSAGSLVAIIRRNGFANLYRRTSSNSGETWSAEVVNIALDAASPDMPELQYCQDGDLLLAYAKDRASPEYHIARSTNHGATWASDFAVLWNNTGAFVGFEPGGLTGTGGYCSFVEVSRGTFVAVYDHDQSNTARVFATHFTKVESGQLNAWTDTTRSVDGEIYRGVEFSDADQVAGNASLDYFNNVHNGGAFTISGWAKFNQTTEELHCFMGSAASSQDRGFFFGYENRAAAGTPNGLRLFKADGSGGTVNNQTASISGDTSPHRYGVFCSALGVPTFIKDTTTYAGTTAITATAGNSELPFRVGGVSFVDGLGGQDSPAGRLDGWMEMWTLSSQNLGADYERTRYASESSPATFASPSTSTDGTSPIVLYWVVYAAAGSAPSGAQIIAGQDATGSAASASGSEIYVSPGVYDETTPITGLLGNTSYRVAWVAYDGSSYSAVVVSDVITTTSAGIILSLVNCLQDATSASIVVSSSQVISIDSSTTANTSTDVSINKTATIVVNNSSSTNNSASVTIDKTASITVSSATQNASSNSVSLDASSNNITVDISNTANISNSVSIEQLHNINVTASTIDSTSNSIDINKELSILVEASTSTNTSPSVGLTTSGIVNVASSVQVNTSSSVSVAVLIDISVAATSGDSNCSTIQIAQLNNLQVSVSSSTSTSNSVAIDADRSLVVSTSTTTNSSSEVFVTQNHVFVVPAANAQSYSASVAVSRTVHLISDINTSISASEEVLIDQEISVTVSSSLQTSISTTVDLRGRGSVYGVFITDGINYTFIEDSSIVEFIRSDENSSLLSEAA